MKTCYKIFHVDKYVDREPTYLRAEHYLSQKYERLETPTICLESVDLTPVENLIPELKFLPQGFWDPLGSGVRGWKPGDLSFWIGSYLAWKKFLESDYDILVLCEDDVEFKDSFLGLLEQRLTLLPNDWDIFSAYCDVNQYFKYRLSHSLDDSSICRSYQDWSMLCYVLNRKGAQALVDCVESEIIQDPIDWYIFYQPQKFHIYTVKPRYEQGILSNRAESTINGTTRHILVNHPLDGIERPSISHFREFHGYPQDVL